MTLKRSLLILPIFTLLFSCSSTNKQAEIDALGPLSLGGQLIVDTGLLSLKEFTPIIESNRARQLEANPEVPESGSASNPFASSDFLFGSGLVSSAVFFGKTGAFVNPSKLMNMGDLGMWALAGLFDNSMKDHPSMYNHFYARNCDDTDCFEEKYSAFMDEYMRLLLETDAVKNNRFEMREPDIRLSNFVIDQFKFYIRDDATEAKDIVVASSISAIHMGKLNKDLNIWGNRKVRNSPDRMWVSKGLGYVKNADLLRQASAKHPDITIYIAIDKKRLENNQPCFGGFFVQQGKHLPVDEFNCVKMIPDSN